MSSSMSGIHLSSLTPSFTTVTLTLNFYSRVNCYLVFAIGNITVRWNTHCRQTSYNIQVLLTQIFKAIGAFTYIAICSIQLLI